MKIVDASEDVPAHALATGLRGLVSLLEEAGRPGLLEAALSEVGISIESLRDGSATMSVQQMVFLQETVADLTRWSDLGLRLAERFHPGDWGALGYMLMHCATIGQMLQELGSYVQIFQQDAGVRFERHPDGISISYGIERSVVGRRRQDAEASLAMALKLIRVACARRVIPAEVWFEHEAPAEIGPHRRFFGIPVYFARGRNILFFDTEIGNLPIQGADPRLHEVLRRYIDEDIAESSSARSLPTKLQRILRGMIPSADPTLSVVAAQIGLTERALQRRLVALKTNFKREVALTRIEIAKGLLSGTELEIKEIAFAAGFSTLPAFSRAFRTAVMHSPSEWRTIQKQKEK